jgi:tRNA A-37 threonylcarbamoyl transferase component Bud32
MDDLYLKTLKYDELKNIAIDMDINIPKTKFELINKIIECFTEYEKYKKEKIDKYKKIEQLGNKGKEGVTYLVKTNDGSTYAMKTFKKNKSSNRLRNEARLQEIASNYNISPKIIEIDTVSKYIVMEKLDKHLFDILKEKNGILNIQQQKQIIKIFKTLDECKIFHADCNILNYMYKNKKLYIIDFGMSKEIDDKLIKKLGTSTPNLDISTLGFILKLKEFNCPSISYSYLLNYINDDIKIKFNLN